MGLYRRYGTKDKYKEKVRNVMIGAVLIFLAVVTLFPIYYMVISSFGAPTEAGGASYSLIPRSFSLASYEFFFDYSRYSFRWIMNSLLVAGVVTVSNVVFASLAGYAFAKLRFPGCRFFFFLLLVAMMIPYQVTQVPLYILFVNKFKMTNTFTALILPGCVTSYNIFLSKQFFSGIPTSLIENAKVEGATQFRIFRSIILPLSKTVLAVMAINTFMGNWNTFFWPFLVTSKEAMYTIQVGLKTFKFANGTLLSPMMAGATISALPMFVLFFSLQKYFLEGVTIGAVKG